MEAKEERAKSHYGHQGSEVGRGVLDALPNTRGTHVEGVLFRKSCVPLCLFRSP